MQDGLAPPLKTAGFSLCCFGFLTGLLGVSWRAFAKGGIVMRRAFLLAGAFLTASACVAAVTACGLITAGVSVPEALMADWRLAVNGEKVFRIEPLK